MIFMIRFSFFLVLILAALPVFGQDPTPTPTPTPAPADRQDVRPESLRGVPEIAPEYRQDDRSLPDLGRVGVDLLRQRPLSMNEAIKLALENNKDIEVTRQNVRAAEFELQAARGFYEPRLTGQSYFEQATTPNVSIFSNNATTTNDTLSSSATVSGALSRFGTGYSAVLANQRFETNNPISLLSPQTNTSLTFTLNQPLLRGRSFDQTRRVIEIAKRNLSLTDSQFRQRSIEIITNVQRAYWDLTFALRNLQVQRDGVRDAKDQLEHNKRLVAEGSLAPIDIVAAETQVALLEQNVYEALEAVNRAENALKFLIVQNNADGLWVEAIVPTDPVDLETPRTTLPEALALALQNRPEIQVNNVQKDINEIDQRYFRDQSKPQIDLTATYLSGGVGGSRNPRFEPFFPSPCDTAPSSPACQEQIARLNALTGSSVSDVFLNKYPTFRVGVTINLPLQNRTAKANLGRSLVQSEQISTQREQIEQGIQVDVRNALQAIRTAEARLRGAAVARENLQKQYESEQRRLDAGQSDIYKVLERQTALMNGRSAELRAQTELNKAIADLQRATGNSLKANNVEARLR